MESKQPYLIHKSKWGGCQNEETKKHGSNERTDQNSKNELNEIEISNLPDVKFKTLLIMMLKELSEDPNSIKKIQSEIMDTLIEIKNNLQRNKSRVDKAENEINDWEDEEAKNNQSEQQEEKRILKNEDSISSLWDNFNRSNTHIIRVPEGEETEQEIGNLFEKIMKENFANLVKEINTHVQEAQKSHKQDGCKEIHSKKHHI